MKKLLTILLCGIAINAFAGWKSHFAYTNVTQIAMGRDCVYGLSDGALFSVDKQSEKMTEWTKLNGMHSTGIWQIGFDNVSNTLLVVYGTGRVDLIKGKKVTYLSDFYNKDMTASKRANNISFHKGRAYLSMEFGIISFDTRKHEFVDTYYIGPEASEVNVLDVRFIGDSIYAFTQDKLYSAALKDNIVDFRFWKSEPRSDRIKPEENKGKQYTDTNNDVWYAGGADGIVRHLYSGEQMAYKPDGPLTNIPYRLKCSGGKLYMLSGGRWAAQYNRPGHVMILQDDHWTNISSSSIQEHTGKPARDFMNIAIDPRNLDHYFVTSFGTGLYEFLGTEFLNRYMPDNSSITAAIPSSPNSYTRVDGAVFDTEGNLMLVSTSSAGPTIPILTNEGDWTGVNFSINGIQFPFYAPGEMLIDVNNPNYKWIPYVRGDDVGLVLWDDNGTLTDDSDDRCFLRKSFTAQDGEEVTVTRMGEACFDQNGNLWVGSDAGVIIIDKNTDFFTSDACRRIRIKTSDDTYLLNDELVNDIELDDDGKMWVGTNDYGVYVMSSDAKEVLFHYTTDNTIMPADMVLSIACNKTTNQIFIGTGQGLVSYCDRETTVSESVDVDETDVDYGSMRGWTLHPAFSNVNAIAASDQTVYALSEGALFSVNRTDEQSEYYNKLTGLSSSNIRFITYNKDVNKLLIIYQNGLMDFLEDDKVTALADLYLKGETREMTMNNIATDKQYVYMAMSFGIIVLDMKKGEIADTYYIGKDAEDVNVSAVAVNRDTLYAVSEDHLYYGALKDNLIDFSKWSFTDLPYGSGAITLTSSNDVLYLLQGTELYYRAASQWVKLTDEPVYWVRSSANKLLASTATKGFVEIAANGKITTLTTDYNVYDAVHDHGEYWLAAGSAGLLRYKDKSYSAFQPNGPLSNFSYHLQFAGDRLMMAQGGRWSTQYLRLGDVIFYDYTQKQWSAIPFWKTAGELNYTLLDIMNYAVDPANNEHFFATSYGNGVAEFLNGHAVAVYNETNSTLRSSIENDVFPSYVRTSGAIFDQYGNLWVLNTGTRAAAINIRTPQGKWSTLDIRSNGQKVVLNSPGDIIQDIKYPNSKWFVDCRATPGVILIDDGGTPLDPSDDHTMKRREFYDQLGTLVSPAYILCAAQDRDGVMWIGTEAGPFMIESAEKFLASNKCKRTIIYRNDGTNLVDYLLKSEQINAICIDGGNRKWLGTANSGVFLMSPDGDETIYHFMTTNSPLPSNEILSIAIHPETGEVFFGTAAGLVSFRSDAAEPAEDFSEIYAYPNPVRPNYEGVITIKGLMDKTVVNIIDAGGNLVCKTNANGGIAIWDGKNMHGKRVATGVYTVLCNTADGSNRAVTKILVTH